MSDVAPLVTCIMPTYNRRRFVPRAIEYFLRQDYDRAELLIVDDGTEPVRDLVPVHPRVRYVALPSRLTVGAKRNVACEQASGELILHWDDDDWHAPRRIRYQVEVLLKHGADVCGLDHILFYDTRDRSAWTYRYPSGERGWLYGNSLCYRRAFWERNRFPDVQTGEDTTFIWQAADARLLPLADSTFHVSIMHGHNVSAHEVSGSYWQRHDPGILRQILGSDTSFYDSAIAPLTRQGTPARDFGMTAALENDLLAPEFVAFREGHELPRMRTWELPYALFAARLRDTAAVLDCTINPCRFGDRIARLYPHVLYRQWSPLQGGRFVLPSFPDAAVDCVFCINTLEHLLREQREALVADFARCLKPGGRLVLTSDYYFESVLSSAELLATGLVRADRAEVLNGFNRVTARDWVALCQPHGLIATAGMSNDLREDDPALFRNMPPFSHACIGGVFVKGNGDLACPPRTVVLALLTWNTCAATMDSVYAHAREAGALARAGHNAIVCVCDNGSDDGTREALQAMEPSYGVPHKFIYNDENRGSSAARNQIIEFALQAGADYLLFVDGDIETVPFSTMAMLRHMESSGRWLGCLGADSSLWSSDRNAVSRCLYSVADCRILTTSLVAWTQYGMFRTRMFADGVRFDEAGPFGQPGWGLEDNDLAFQMEVKGYRNEYFGGMTYLHRAIRSSVHNLRRRGVDTSELFARRKQYLVDKWSGNSRIEGELLNHIRHMPVLV